MEKLLIICGPTATGKTALAINLAKKYNGELVNADSRQLYEGLDVVTGKDLPHGAKPTHVLNVLYREEKLSVKTYDIGVPIWLCDLVRADVSVSISIYQVAARVAIENIRARGKLPILVGGSGLYIRSLVDNIETIDIPQNIALRSELSKFNINALQQKLRTYDEQRFDQMNHSDRHNPRRLIRAIEVAEFYEAGGKLEKARSVSEQVLWIGLRYGDRSMEEAISKRVESRWKDGAVEEVQDILSQNVSTSIITTLGVTPIKEFIEGSRSEEEAKISWAKEEVAYAKRQMVWFKKNKQIVWFDANENTLYDQVEKLVVPWYTKS